MSETKVENGVTVAIPNTTKEKMKAICDLSAAVKSLAEAVNHVNVTVEITGCTISKHGDGPAVKVGFEESNKQ